MSVRFPIESEEQFKTAPRRANAPRPDHNWLGVAAMASVPISAHGVVPTSLYRYYDKNGILLYVGITGRGMRRNQEHNQTKDWWPFVARQEVDHYSTRAEAEIAEKAYILAHRPPFNVQHNPDHAGMRLAYMKAGLKTTLQARLAWMKRYVPADLLDATGGRWLYRTPAAYADIVRLFDRDLYGFKVSIKRGRAKVTRETDSFYVKITGDAVAAQAPRQIGLRFNCVKQKPIILAVGGVNLDYAKTRVNSKRRGDGDA